jgi:hypothetical protein
MLILPCALTDPHGPSRCDATIVRFEDLSRVHILVTLIQELWLGWTALESSLFPTSLVAETGRCLGGVGPRQHPSRSGGLQSPSRFLEESFSDLDGVDAVGVPPPVRSLACFG